MLEEQPASEQLSPEEEGQLNNLLGSGRQSPNTLRPSGTGEGSDLSDQEQSQLDDLINSNNKPTMKIAASAEAPSTLVTRLRRPVAGAGEPEPTWGETFQGAGKNLLPSSARLIGETAKALTINLPETAQSIGQIISGLSSKTAGAFGYQQTPEEKQKKEAVVDALGRHYAETYGSVEGFKKALAKDPASILADLSLPFSGGAGALAKTAKVGSLAEKALALTAKGAQYLDPTQAALSVAGSVAKVPTAVLRGLSSARSGVAYSSLTDVYNLAKQGNQVQKEAFDLGRKATEPVIFERVHNSFDSAAQKASDAYVNNMGNLAQEPANWGRVLSKIDQEIEKIQKLNPKTGEKFVVSGNENTLKELETARKDVVNYQDAGGNISEADAYKRSLYNIVYGRSSGDRAAKDALGRIAKETRDSVEAIDKNYATIMDQWQEWLNLSNELKSAGAAGSKAGDTAALEKLMKALKKPEKRKNTIDVLTEHDEGIPYLLAGYATKPMFRGAPNIMDLALGGIGYHLLTHPAGAVGAVYAMSPRAGSMTQTALGTLDKYGSAATRPAITYGAEQLRPGEEGEAPTASAALTSEPRNARNNNPGNIKDGSFAKDLPGYKGSDGTFAIFETPEAGSNALENLLGSYINRGYNTVSKIIERYAPVGAENSAESSSNYIRTVAKKLGVDPNQEIGLDTVKNLMRAISGFEGKEIAAAGGRIGRASGGRAVNHADMAEKLVRQAERVKKVQGEGTEALLDHQDDAIISALEIANRHI